jgi:SAM-dependent methyltransferase
VTDRDIACEICGHSDFRHADVLWPTLVAEWDLTPDEAAYINAQQGTSCVRCGGNLRSQALARAILMVASATGPLDRYVEQAGPRAPATLEVNAAGTLTPYLSQLSGYQFGAYPACDLESLPFPDGHFDLVVHSDTLEHVPDPARGLAECWRVLRSGGALAFTVPVVVGRMTRSRAGLEASFHGHPGCLRPDYRVHTEFGCDVWTTVLAAGFATCEFVAFRYPAGLAMVARRR